LVSVKLSSSLLISYLGPLLLVGNRIDWELEVRVVILNIFWSPSIEQVRLSLCKLNVEVSHSENNDDNYLDSRPLDVVGVGIVTLLDLEHRVAIIVIVVSQIPGVAFGFKKCDCDEVSFAHFQRN